MHGSCSIVVDTDITAGLGQSLTMRFTSRYKVHGLVNGRLFWRFGEVTISQDSGQGLMKYSLVDSLAWQFILGSKSHRRKSDKSEFCLIPLYV